jgi:polyisoprenoid-binding protein YceI
MMVTTVRGRFTGVTGTIMLDEDDITRSRVTATIDASTITTGEPDRDAHLRSVDFLDMEQYPTMTFTSTRVEPAGHDRLRLIGDLTIRGVTRAVTFETVSNGRGLNPDGQQVIGFAAETTISRSDFGLVWNVALEAGGVLVSDAVKISLEVQAVQSETKA